MLIVCPGCGSRFDPVELGDELQVLEPHQLVAAGVAAKRQKRAFDPASIQVNDDGTAYRSMTADDPEKHVDMRLRCPKCSYHQR